MAVNKIISKNNKITNVQKRDNELFFLYDTKYKWSIRQATGEVTEGRSDYFLYYYPATLSLEQLAKLEDSEWKGIDLVEYSTRDLKTREAYDSFRELYTIVNEKLHGFDSVLDEIIEDDIF